MKKRVLSFLLVLCMIAAFVPMLGLQANAATGLTLQELKNKFPAGQYWNGNNPDKTTGTPCTIRSDGSHPDVGDSDLGSSPGDNYWCGACQCAGFALKVAYDAIGQTSQIDWGSAGFTKKTTTSALDNLKAGDILRVGKLNDRPDINGHSVFITSVNGDSFTFGDCNTNNKEHGGCWIRWDQTSTKTAVKNGSFINSGWSFYYVLSAPKELKTDTYAYLDLNGYFEGSDSGNIEPWGTADVYIDGKLAADDCADYYQQHKTGTKYEIKDIKAKTGFRYEGVQSGSLSGTIGSSTTSVKLRFSRTPTYVQFVMNGGSVPAANAVRAADGVNTGRGQGQLIIYDQSGSKVATNSYGLEAAINQFGEISAQREYGSDTQLTVPDNGYVISGHVYWENGVSVGASDFVREILTLGGYVGYDYDANQVKAFASLDGYLASFKRYSTASSYYALPEPTRNGYYFDGWYTSNASDASRVGWGDPMRAATLYAKWTKQSEAKPVAATTYQNNRYELYDYHMSWTEARAFCESRGGHLVTITDAAEQSAMLNLAAQGGNDLYYLGCTDPNNVGDYKWITGETFSYQNWDPHAPEPTNADGEYYAVLCMEDYAPNKHVGEWAASKDKAEYASLSSFYSYTNTGFICEYDKTALAVKTQPKNYTGKVGETATFSVKASGDGLSYQWQYSDNNGKTWTNSKSTAAKATCGITAARDGRLYRCVITDQYGGKVTSNSAKLIVAKEAKITTQPTNASGKVGATVTFTVTATGDGLRYQWQYKDVGGSWKNSASTTASANCTIKAERDGRLYRCKVTDKYGNTVTSSSARLTVKPAITAQPKDYAGPVGDTAKFTVKATGAGLSYQWQYSDDNGKTWINSASKTATATCAIKAARDGRLYRCVVTDTHGAKVTSKTAKVNVKTALKITAQPKSCTEKAGTTAKFTVRATGDGLKYQWYYSDNNGKTWTKSNSKTATATCAVKEARDGRLYRCTITDRYGEQVTSNYARLLVV